MVAVLRTHKAYWLQKLARITARGLLHGRKFCKGENCEQHIGLPVEDHGLSMTGNF